MRVGTKTEFTVNQANLLGILSPTLKVEQQDTTQIKFLDRSVIIV